MNTRLWGMVAIAASVLVTTNVARAASTSFSETVGFYDDNNSLLAPQFDPSSGTLTSVDVQFSYSVDARYFVDTDPGSGNVTIVSSGFVQGGLWQVNSDHGDQNSFPYIFSSQVILGFFDVGPLGGGGTATFTSPNILAAFTGPGSLGWTEQVQLSETLDVTTGSTPDIFLSDYAGSVTTEFTYNYDTPVPSALPLFATGLGALGLLGWRRKRKVQAI
jgi:hypothetical protein